MELADDACYEAICARDARFDGRLFIGVKTTGIYCRPVCPARIPKRENVRFYRSAAAAQEAGFRPCLRCRPETAPEIGAWRGTSNTVSRALGMIELGALDGDGVGALAERLGVGERHLRRLFIKHMGASPITVAQTRRVLLAKQLIHESALPMTEVAMAAGFGSLRRFNETFQNLYHRPPTALRRTSASGSSSATKDGINVLLRFRPPYDWEAQRSYLAANAVHGIESVRGQRYARSFEIEGERGSVSVQPAGATALRVTAWLPKLTLLPNVIARVRRVFDLGADPEAIGAHLQQDPLLATRIRARPGRRIAGNWDNFETAVRAVLEHRVGTAASMKVMSLMVATCGEPMAPPPPAAPEITHAFPGASRLASVSLSALGLPHDTTTKLRLLAMAAAEQPALFGAGRRLDEVASQLCRLTSMDGALAEYVATRVLRETDALLVTDPRLLRAAAELLGSESTVAPLLARAERWRPWRAYAVRHLLTDEGIEGGPND